jgi:predicted nucleic acid-binding protein
LTALDLGCDQLLIEDLQDGQRFDTVTVVNPFHHPPPE